MFINKKTKIISAPAEEVLEVEAPAVVLQTVANIEFLTVTSKDEETSTGTLTDYDGNEYQYTWDFKSKRVVRLSGLEINNLTWNLCNEVLKKYFIKQEPAKVEEPIGPKIEEAVQKAFSPVAIAFKNLEGKVDKALTARPAPVPVQSAPRPQAVQSTPSETPAINVAEDDISSNALRFLQDSNVPDLGIDYMSL
jgi:uncharacterized membrane protein